MKQSPLILALGLLVASCGGPTDPPAPPPLDPTGVFTVSIDVDGTQVGGVLTLRGTAAGYTGSIDTDIGSAALADILVDGNQVTFSVPDAGVYFTVVYEGDGFTGAFDGAMGVGSIRGTRRPS